MGSSAIDNQPTQASNSLSVIVICDMYDCCLHDYMTSMIEYSDFITFLTITYTRGHAFNLFVKGRRQNFFHKKSSRTIE